MSKLVAFSALGSAMAGAAVAVIMTLQFVGDQSFETGQDLIEAVDRVSSALSTSSVQLDVKQATEILERLDKLAGGVAKEIDQTGSPLPFVPRSFVGVSDHEVDVPFDFVAPNGESKLLTAKVYNTRDRAGIAVDGNAEAFSIGEHLLVNIGQLECKIELSDISAYGSK